MEINNCPKPKRKRINKSRHFRSFSMNSNIINSVFGQDEYKNEEKEKLVTEMEVLKPDKMSFKINQMLNNQKKTNLTKKINIDFITEGEKEIKNSFFNLISFRGVRIKEENLSGGQIPNFELKLKKRKINDLEIIEECSGENENYIIDVNQKGKKFKTEKYILKKKNIDKCNNNILNFDFGKENLHNLNFSKKENDNFKTSVKENKFKNIKKEEFIKDNNFFIKETIYEKKNKKKTKVKKTKLNEKKKNFLKLNIRTTKDLNYPRKTNPNQTPYFPKKKTKMNIESKKKKIIYKKTSLQDVFISKTSNFKKFYEKFVDGKTRKKNIKVHKKKVQKKKIKYSIRKTINEGFSKTTKNTKKIDLLGFKLDLKRVKKNYSKVNSKKNGVLTERAKNYKHKSFKLKFKRKPLFIQTSKNNSNKKKIFFENYLKKINKTFTDDKSLKKNSINIKSKKINKTNFLYNNKRRILKKSYINQKSSISGFGIFDFNIDKKKIVYRK